MDSELVDRICEQFELGAPTSSRTIGGTRTRSVVLETTTGRWIIRERHPAYSKDERIRFDHQAAEFLRDHGVPVPLPKRSHEGIRLWRESGSVWEVHPFFIGQPLAEGDPPSKSKPSRSLSPSFTKLAGVFRCGTKNWERAERPTPDSSTARRNRSKKNVPIAPKSWTVIENG